MQLLKLTSEGASLARSRSSLKTEERMRKPKPQCTLCENTAGGGLDYCYRCIGAILDNAAPWQPAQRDDRDLPSRAAYKVRPLPPAQ